MTRLNHLSLIAVAAFVGLSPHARTAPAPKASDTTAGPVVIEDKIPDLPVPDSFFGPEVSFADRYGPFVIAGRNGDPRESRLVYDLRTGKDIVTVSGKIDFLEKPCALSPDGKFYACAGGFRKAPTVTVIEVASGQTQELRPAKKAEHLEFISPTQLLTLNNWENSFSVFDLANGKEVATLKTARRNGSPAVSPDGNTLAVVEDENWKKTLQFYDLKTGRKGDSVPLPEAKPFGYGCEALAFSADGKEVGGLFKNGNQLTVLCWKLDGNQLAAQYAITDPVKNVFFSGQKFQWSPDGRGWFVNGELAVDRDTGKVVWKADPPFKEACRMVAFNQVVGLVDKGGGKRVIASTGVTKQQLAGMVKVVRSGGSAVDALLPKLTETDLAGVKSIEVPLGNTPLEYKADPAGSGSRLAARPISLACAGKEVESLQFSRPEAGVVVVELKSPDHGPFQPAPKAVALERYSLVTGKKLGRFDLKFAARLAAVSPDGKQVLLVEAEQAGRLDLWDFNSDTPRHIAGWRPYAKEGDEKGRKVAFAAITAPGRVLTANAAGRVLAWSLPACKAEWEAEVPNLTGLRLSPGGKYLVGFDRDQVRLLDAATGAPAGDLAVPEKFPAGKREAKAVAVRPDGAEAAALYQVLGENGSAPSWAVVRWDLTGGKALEPVPFRSAVAGNPPALEYVGSDHLLIDNTALLDFKRKDVVWTYRLSSFDGKHATAPPDGRHWYAIADFPNPSATLVAVKLPEPGIEGYAREIEGKDAIVKPGQSITVQTELKGDQGDRVAETARANARKALKAVGFVPADAGALVLTLSATENDTGQTVEFRKLFSGFGESPFARTQVKLLEITCQATLTYDGKPIWKSAPEKHGMRTIGIVTLPEGEKDIGRFLRTRMWDNVAAWAGRAAPPRYVAQTSEGIMALPGTTLLRGDGLGTQPPVLNLGK